MADHCEGWDEVFDCHYSVSVTPKEGQYYAHDLASVHWVHIDLNYVFTVSPDDKTPIAQIDHVIGGCWCLQDYPSGLSGLQRPVIDLLDRVGIPLAAQKNTIRMIFQGVLNGEYRRRLRMGERQAFGVLVKTETVSEAEDSMEEDEDEDPIEDEDVNEERILEYYEDEADEEYGRVVEELMEEGFLHVRARPAKGEAVEALEKVRVKGEERETGCAVCMDEFALGIEAMKMPCSHVFHQDCLVRWLGRQCFCPLCKFELPSVEEEA